MLFLSQEGGDDGVDGVDVPLALVPVTVVVEMVGDSLVVVLELNAFQKTSLFPLGLQEEEEDLLGLTGRESPPPTSSKLGEDVDIPKFNC